MKFIKQLGTGGFGVVDLVADKKGNYFARKTFAPSQKLSADLLDNVRKRFVREARTQQGFNHRNILPVVGGDLEGDSPYYLMPVAESSLADDIADERTLNGNFVGAMNEIVAALKELHSLDIYHRDLKPQNILRLSDGDGFYYAVSDFGLISQKDSALSKLTTTGMAKGSDYFTAPEITADLKRATAQSDIYSLGCILHEMIGLKDRVPCQEIREDGDYAQILLGCTRNDPDRRFRSVQAVLDALISIDAGVPAPKTDVAKEFANLLEGPVSISESDWSKFIEYVEDHRKTDDAKALLLRLGVDHITEVCNSYLPLADRLGTVFAEWASAAVLNFDTCDVIANRIQVFFAKCGLGARVECLMALLLMGTSHNRWYVEGMFVKSCGAGMDEVLAKRLGIEFRARQEEVCYAISHLERSISANRSDLHPALVQTLAEICK